jgi:hypothetical protein
LYQEGIPEYDANTTYAQGSACKIPSVTNAKVVTSCTNAALTISVTSSTFSQAIQNVTGNYKFTYNGTNWTYGSSSITDLSNSYGIVVTGDPASGDVITVAFTAQTVALNLYKSLQDDNTGNDPTSSPYWWASWDFGSSGAGLPIGAVFVLTCTDTYVPDGALPCNGNSYSVAQFSEFVTNYLETGYLKTCTMTVYEQQLATYGTCGMFGYESGGSNFRVPCLKDGTFIQQANSNSELGQSYNAGLPNITGTFASLGSDAAPYAHAPYSTGSGAIKFDKNGNYLWYYGQNYYGVGGWSFDASRTSSIYGNSDTVQPNAVALRYFVQVANGQINQSDMDWSAWATGLTNKVDLDAQNLSNEGTSYISGLSMPSDKYIDLTLGSSGDTYTAPANGWVLLRKGATSQAQYIFLVNDITRFGVDNSFYGAYTKSITIPVNRGEQFVASYNATGTTEYFRFYYAQGEA